MGCQLHSSNPQLLSRLPIKKPAKLLPSCCSVQPKIRIQTAILSSSTTNTTTQREAPEETDAYSVKFKTLGGCKLGIARYPDFKYNADGGKGTGRWGKKTDEGEISVGFDMKTLYIPPLMSSTTRFLGLPLPPFLKIDIVPELFEGFINNKSGQVDLKFRAKFWFSVGSIYRAPPLMVETVLTSEESKGTLRSGRGERLNEAGKCKLVGVATVDPIDDFLMDSFLSLPTECLAVLNATISFSSS